MPFWPEMRIGPIGWARKIYPRPWRGSIAFGVKRFLVSQYALRNYKRIANRRNEWPLQRLTEVEDLRLFHPERAIDFKTVSGSPVRYSIPGRYASVDKRKKSRTWVPAAIGFQNPSVTLVCVRRKRRKEVLHALGVAGGRVRPPEWNESSYIHC